MLKAIELTLFVCVFMCVSASGSHRRTEKDAQEEILKVCASIYGRWIFGTTFRWFSAQALCVLTHRPRDRSLLLWFIQPKGHRSETSNTERLAQCDPQRDVSSALRMMLILGS